jgi:predicted ArsR family transcriptional regulator
MASRPLPMVDLPISLERDGFLRSMLRELSGTLQDVVGLDEASGFISVVGQHIGDELNAGYRTALGVETLDHEQVANTLVDLKRRIQGDFTVVQQDESRIELTNTRCPFGDKVLDRPALCMMTSNVFGSIAAENLGYARVELRETIAEGHGRCHVIVHVSAAERVAEVHGREYFKR